MRCELKLKERKILRIKCGDECALCSSSIIIFFSSQQNVHGSVLLVWCVLCLWLAHAHCTAQLVWIAYLFGSRLLLSQLVCALSLFAMCTHTLYFMCTRANVCVYIYMTRNECNRIGGKRDVSVLCEWCMICNVLAEWRSYEWESVRARQRRTHRAR